MAKDGISGDSAWGLMTVQDKLLRRRKLTIYGYALAKAVYSEFEGDNVL